MRIPTVRFGKDRSPTAWWEWLFGPVVWPVLIALLLIPGGLSIPYFWLYAERHANLMDAEGSAEERRRLREYRAHRGRVSLWRRVLEKARLVPFDDGPGGADV